MTQSFSEFNYNKFINSKQIILTKSGMATGSSLSTASRIMVPQKNWQKITTFKEMKYYRQWQPSASFSSFRAFAIMHKHTVGRKFITLSSFE